MKELAMCRVCLAEDVRLRLIANTHLQEMYESLTLLPLETKDSRPIQACYICCAGLQNCYQLRKRCFQSEELFTHILSSNLLQPLNLQGGCTQRLRVKHPVIHLSIGEELQNNTDDDTIRDSANRVGISNVVEHETVKRADIEDAVEVKIEIEDMITVENEPNSVGSPLSADEISPKIVKTYLNNGIKGATAIKKIEDSTSLLIARPECVSKNIKVEATSLKHRDDKVKAHYENKKETSRSNVSKNKKSKSKAHLDPRTHISENRFKCDVCNKCFRSKYHLRRHSYTHSGLKPYICNVCQGSFAQKCDLVIHVRIHTNEKPYRCNFCKKGFSHKCQLTLHTRKHTGEKPHVCDLCKRCFARKSALTEHARTHSGNKPHICEVCKKCFYEKYKLTAHTRMHTGEQKLHIVTTVKKVLLENVCW